MSITDNQQNNSPAAQLMAIEIISELLVSTSPHKLGEALTAHLRELTGARTVMVLTHRPEPDQDELLYACPQRRNTLFSSAELNLFCHEKTPGELPFLSEDLSVDHPLAAPLQKAGIHSMARYPLRVGGELIAQLLLLDLPDLKRIAETSHIINLLAPPIALALKNALAFRLIEEQAQELEQRVEERTAELHRMNAELLESDERLSRALQLNSYGLWEWNIETNAEYFSPRWCEIIGYSFNDPELIHTYDTWAERIHPDDYERVVSALENHLENNVTYDVEYRHLHRSGEYRWQNSRGQALFDKKGMPFKMVGCISDITERKQIEELQVFLAQTSGASSGESFFDNLARFLGQKLDIDYVCIDRLEGEGLTARTLSVWHDGHFEDNVSYDLKDTPCGDVAGKEICCFPSGVCQLFPNDQALQDLRAESYIGTTLWNYIGQPVGLIVLISRKPLMYREVKEAALKLVAARAAGEIQRLIADETLRESKEKYRLLVDNLAAGVVVHAPDTTVIFANRMALSLLGLSKDQIKGKTALDPDWCFVRENGTPMPLEEYPINQVISTGAMLKDFVLGIRHTDVSDPTWLLCNAYPATTPAGKLQQVVVTFHDITSRKLAEEKNQLNNARLKSLVNILQYPAETIQAFLDNALNEAIDLTSSKIGYIYFYDEDCQEFELNSWSKDVMEACAVTNPQTIYHLDKTGFWGEAVRQRKTIVLNEFTADNLLKKGYPEGHVHLVRFMSVPVFFNGRIVAVVGVANKNSDYDEGDVLQLTLLMDSVWKYVENKRGEAALEQERTLSQIYLDTVETMIVVLDVDGMIVTINRKALLVLGYEEKELLGKYWFTTCLPQPVGIEITYPHFLKTMAGEFGQSEYHENEVVTKSGEILQIAWHNALLRNDQGLVCGIISAGDDITDSQRAEKVRLSLENQLHQAQKMESVGRLAGGVAHDFNNLLSVIIGHSYLGLLKLDEQHPVREDLKIISQSAERSAELTQQLLAFARKQTVSPKVIDLNDTVTTMLKMLQRLIGEDIHLTWQPAAGLWPLKVDPSQIDQILVNLSVNARDSLSDNGRITIETANCAVEEYYARENPDAVPGDYVTLTVSDNGCGMDKETVTHIFEPFFTTKGVGQGTGLGLATVYGAVKQNGGFITVYSEPDMGTKFTIHLPRYADQEIQSDAENEEKPPLCGTETILLVEDEPDILNVVSVLLTRQGYTVLQAQSAGEARGLAREHTGEINLLMTDVIMPEMNGRDLAKLLQATDPNLRVLFMSGYTADVIAHHGVLDEGVHFIQKPFSLPEMAAMVREVLDKP